MKRSTSANAIRRCSRVASRPSARRQACCGHNQRLTTVSPAPPRGRGGRSTCPHLTEGHSDGRGDTGGGAGIGEVLQEDAIALQQDVRLARQQLGTRRCPVCHCVVQLTAVRCHLQRGGRRW